MAKRKQVVTTADKLNPAGSQVRPGMRRVLVWTLRSGKLVALLLAIASAWALYDALKSPRFEVQEVSAIGIQALTQQDVSTLANVEHRPIWFVDPDAVAAQVAQSPYVEHAKARLILPDRIEIFVSERKPEVRWIHDGVMYAVTWDGLIVDRVQSGGANTVAPSSVVTATQPLSDSVATAPLSATTPLTPTEEVAPPNQPEGSFVSTVTIVDTTPNRPIQVGQQVDADALELARRVILRQQELPAPITRIEWDGGLGVSLIFGEHQQAVLGHSDDLDRKLATLRFLLNDHTPFTYLDLRSSTPYYR